MSTQRVEPPVESDRSQRHRPIPLFMPPQPTPPVPTGQDHLPLIPFSVFTEYGHSVNLSLSVTTTFAEIKAIFEERLGIPRSWQSFYSHWEASPSNTRFADSQTLLDFLATLRGLRHTGTVGFAAHRRFRFGSATASFASRRLHRDATDLRWTFFPFAIPFWT
jgi:hypothetical protein